MSGTLDKSASNEGNGYSEKIEGQGQQIEQTPIAPRSSFLAIAKRHFKRFWWAHLIFFCASVLIIALCLVYVAMPKIAQRGVNRSSTTFTDLNFLDPTANTIVLSQDAILHSPSMYTPTLDPFSAALYLVTNGTYAATPMLSIMMPKIHALHPKSIVHTPPQTLNISDMDQLTDYCIQVLTQENVTTALVGKTKLHEGKLPVITVKYNSSTTYKSLNGLAGFNVTDLKLNLSAPAGQPNLVGKAFIPNPSVMTIAMGNVTLNLSTDQAGIVGNSTIHEMTLVPGNNTFSMTSIIDAGKVTSSMNKSGIVTLKIIGTSSVYNGQHLPYYEKALASNVLTLDLNVAAVLANSQ